jgi:hypothetical protein
MTGVLTSRQGNAQKNGPAITTLCASLAGMMVTGNTARPQGEGAEPLCVYGCLRGIVSLLALRTPGWCGDTELGGDRALVEVDGLHGNAAPHGDGPFTHAPAGQREDLQFAGCELQEGAAPGALLLMTTRTDGDRCMRLVPWQAHRAAPVPCSACCGAPLTAAPPAASLSAGSVAVGRWPRGCARGQRPAPPPRA